MRVICCGNRQRGDDAAGLLVADRLRGVGVEAEIRNGEVSELMEAWSGVDSVVLVDAVVTGKPAGTVQVWDGRKVAVRSISPASTHGLGVGEAIELARTLGRLPKMLQVYGIEGRQFVPGASVSHEVESAAEEVARQIAALAGAFPDGAGVGAL